MQIWNWISACFSTLMHLYNTVGSLNNEAKGRWLNSLLCITWAVTNVETIKKKLPYTMKYLRLHLASDISIMKINAHVLHTESGTTTWSFL